MEIIWCPPFVWIVSKAQGRCSDKTYISYDYWMTWGKGYVTYILEDYYLIGLVEIRHFIL
jgi:hypothetical protein